MKFVFPCKEYEGQIREFVRECLADRRGGINGTSELVQYLREESYDAWLKKIVAEMDVANVPADRAPSLTYFYVSEEDDKIAGAINVRLRLTDSLRKEGGHIGYSIAPSRRQKGYGTQMLRETLEFCRSIGLCRVLITCTKDNEASAGVIKKCGGVLEDEIYSQHHETMIQRYWIG